MGTKQVWSIRTPEYDALIKLIRRTRDEAGVSQRQLSADLKQSRNYIQSIENRSRRVDPVEVVAIAKALKISAKALLLEYLKEIGAD